MTLTALCLGAWAFFATYTFCKIQHPQQRRPR